ncbi:hypothetical protein RQP46_005696 [Phenoliferia psychrophenolica]
MLSHARPLQSSLSPPLGGVPGQERAQQGQQAYVRSTSPAPVVSQSYSPGETTQASFPTESPKQHLSTSILDRPRPKTPDPFSSGSHFSSAYTSRAMPIRSPISPPPPSSPHSSRASPAPSPIQPTSILNRPRPKTPEPAFFTSPAASPQQSFRTHTPTLSDPNVLTSTTSPFSHRSTQSSPQTQMQSPSQQQQSRHHPTPSSSRSLTASSSASSLPSSISSEQVGTPPVLELDLGGDSLFDLASILGRAQSNGKSQREAQQAKVAPAEVKLKPIPEPSPERHPEPAPTAEKRSPSPKRRRSLASLLSFSPPPEPPRSPPLSPSRHSFSASKGSLTSLTSTSTSSSSQYSLPLAASTSATAPAVPRLDKSLPPTPAPQSPAATMTSFPPLPPSIPHPQLAAASTSALPDDSPTKGQTSLSPSAIRRGLSKLRPQTPTSTSSVRNTSFQLVSATSSRRSPVQTPTPTASSSSPTPTAASASASRRFVERFSPKQAQQAADTTSLSSHSDGETADLTMLSLTTVTAEMPPPSPTSPAPAPKRAFPKPPRRASLSGLLGESKLGMSLGAGRKSEDLLLLMKGRKSSEMGEGDRPALVGRGSFDALTTTMEKGKGKEKEKPVAKKGILPRRSSTDNLLSLATAKLSKLGLTKDPVKPSSTKPPPAPLTLLTTSHRSAASPAHSSSSFLPSSSSPVSLSSTASNDHSPEKAAVVSTATRVAPPAVAPAPAPPMLVRGDSLRASSERPNGSSEEDGGGVRALGPSPAWRKRVKVPDSGVGSDSSMSSAWIDIEDASAGYATAVKENREDRGNMVTNTLLPFLRREEDSSADQPRPDDALAKRQRQVLFGWLSTLTNELREMQPSHRGACLEAVAAIAESRFMSAPVLADDPVGQARYRSAIVRVLAFAIEKLNDKAVYANTLVFSGRVFALAFFRIEGVAFKLLRALPPVKRLGLQRILEEAGVDPLHLPPVNLDAYPSHLWSLCLRDFSAYTTLLLPPVNRPPPPSDSFLVQDGDVSVEMSGNWLIRWTASDSDLPFAFYRAYHRQLASHLIPPGHAFSSSAPLSPTAVVTAPGFLFLAASLLDKCDGLIKVNLRSVTSIGPNSGANFNTNDSANLNFGQKPKVLELANRRLVTTMLDIVGGPPPASPDDPDVAPDADARRHAFSAILAVWIRACVKRVSMWNTRGVFLLMDLVEGLIYTLSYPTPTGRGSGDDLIVPRPQESCIAMFDPTFIFKFVKVILETGDNTVALMRTIAFIYAHFEIFTLRPQDRDELCENIILDAALFPRLYLHWNPGVRGYFIRLLVWRLGRLGVVAGELPPPSERDPRVVAIFGLMNFRLDAIRNRHDELEPAENLTDDDPFRPPKRSTICSTRGVKEAPFAVDELVGTGAGVDSDSDSDGDEPQELVRAIPSSANGSSNGGAGRKGNGIREVATVARVVSWLKGGLGKARQNGSNGGGGNGKGRAAAPTARIDPFLLEDSPAPTLDADDSWTEGASMGLESAPSTDSHDGTSWDSPPASSSSAASITTTTPERTRPPRSSPAESPAFFSFEFEGGVPVARPSSSDSSSNLAAPVESSPTKRMNPEGLPHGPGGAIVSPRVSLRFSKRISILPPAALDMLKESGDTVPPIPARFLSEPQGYDKKLHPYALRGLKEYEDACEEWIDWTVRLQEEEDLGKKHNRGFIDTVPRLSVNWPSAFEDGGQ